MAAKGWVEDIQLITDPASSYYYGAFLALYTNWWCCVSPRLRLALCAPLVVRSYQNFCQ